MSLSSFHIEDRCKEGNLTFAQLETAFKVTKNHLVSVLYNNGFPIEHYCFCDAVCFNDDTGG